MGDRIHYKPLNVLNNEKKNKKLYHLHSVVFTLR